MKATVELGGGVVGRLAKRLLHHERVVRHTSLQVGDAATAVPNGARLHQPAPVTHEGIQHPGRLAARFEQRLEDASDLARSPTGQRVGQREDLLLARVGHQGANGVLVDPSRGHNVQRQLRDFLVEQPQVRLRTLE